ncbi:MAG: LarC family nickel insertion protein, partial [Bacillota bacterium]|nr:LarC family nickel insertion protein [Bacillota bacterium]
IEAELLTPTGAAILTTIAEFGQRPAMTVLQTGYGAGKKDLTIPNLLRVTIGEAAETAGILREDAIVLEANIDDLNPEIYSYVTEQLFAAGALDVTLIPVQMKKNRPGVLLSVLVKPEQEEAAAHVLFRETSTLGVRRSRVEKLMLSRRHITVQTPYGPARVKIGEAGGRILNAAPEYEDCLSLAQKSGAPLKDIYSAVLSAYRT